MQKTVKHGDIIIVKTYINCDFKNQNEFHQGMKIKVGSINNHNGSIVGHKVESSTVGNDYIKGELVLTHTKDILAYGS
tara:strand:- start:3082 stop:3315 length:234 start_codon:yes stop_codon:yes gene_type:complete